MIAKHWEERFWSKVDKTGDCWLWTASIAGAGYGAFRLNGRLPKAHRLAYELLVGPIPDGLELDHLCRNIRCVNPAHLEPVTHRENMRRAVNTAQARNSRKTHCPHDHPYDEANTYRIESGGRGCRACKRIGAAKKRAAIKAAA